MFLSDAAMRVTGQPMFKVLSKVKQMEARGHDIIHFEIVDSDFDTPRTIVDACCSALISGRTHYTDSMGTYELRKTIAENNLKTRGFKPDINQVLVAPGANSLIYFAIQCVANPGDEIIISDPCFPTYESALRLCNVKAVKVKLREENNFSMNPEEIENAITGRTRMIIQNSPNNPTGNVMPLKTQEQIAGLAKKHDIYLYSDEIYSRMIYNDIDSYSPSVVDLCKERTIIADGLSKSFAMTGWRLGMAIGPAKLIEKMGLLVQTIASCVSPFIQDAAIEALTGDQTPIEQMIQTYRRRRDLLVHGLNRIKGISCLNPEGAFYVFPCITATGMNSRQYADFLLNEVKVAVIPGSDFGAMGEGYVRLCYAISEKSILEGLSRIDAANHKLGI